MSVIPKPLHFTLFQPFKNATLQHYPTLPPLYYAIVLCLFGGSEFCLMIDRNWSGNLQLQNPLVCFSWLHLLHQCHSWELSTIQEEDFLIVLVVDAFLSMGRTIWDWVGFDHLSWVFDNSPRGLRHLREQEQRLRIFLATECVNSLRISAPQWWLFLNGEKGSVHEGSNEKWQFLARESVK